MPVVPPRVFNIPASTPFLPALIGALGNGLLVPGFPATREPLELARATLYLPTRRACRLAREAFLDALDGEAAILPRIVPLGDIDEDEIIFAQAATGGIAEPSLTLPRGIESLERRLLLAQLILQWANTAEVRGAAGSPLIANTPAAALGLADDLARLMDDMTTRQIGWDRLDTLVPDDLDEFWQKSLRFLKIARDFWPARLAELGRIEQAERRDRLIEAEARRLADSNAPVIAAGSTGSMPATARLLATIAKLPQGAVVLPGLDTDLDDDSWRTIGGTADDPTHDGAACAGHAQFAMHALLERIGIGRSEVITLGDPALHSRERLVSEALRPAATTDRWQQRRSAGGFDAAAARAVATLGMCRGAARGDRDARQDRRAGDARPGAGAPRRRRAATLAGAGGRFRRRRARRHARGGVRAAGGRGGPEGAGAGGAAGAAEAPPPAPRPSAGSAPGRHRGAGAGAAARTPATARLRRPRRRAVELPQQPRSIAPQRSALADCRRRTRRRRPTRRPARGRAGAAGNAGGARP